MSSQMPITGIGIHDTPTEILDTILDFLHDDKTTLYSCSLVCRQWVSAPRYHIFNPMVIKQHKKFRHGILTENVSSLLSLIQSPYCTILSAIRNVTLIIAKPDLLRDVVHELQRAKALSQIILVRFNSIPGSASLPRMALSLPNIIDFSYNSFEVVHDSIWTTVASFPGLQKLAIYTNISSTFTFRPKVAGPYFLHLRTLRLRLMRSERLLNQLQRICGWQAPLETFELRTFCSSHTGWGSVNALNSFLKANSGSLKHLSIGMERIYQAGYVEEIDLHGTCIDLSTLPNLVTLLFRAHDINSICKSLASLHKSNALQALNLHVLRWGLDTTCECIPLQLLGKLSGIMEENPSFNGTTLDLRVTEIFGELEFLPELFKKWKHGGVLTTLVGYDDETEFQIGKWKGIRPLKLEAHWDRKRPKPS